MKYRKARTSDVKQIQGLVNKYAKRNKIIPRSLNDLYENLRDFVVAEQNGKIVGACALHLQWEDLAEIRSLTVDGRQQSRGIGKTMVRRLLKEARSLGLKRVFALTFIPGYFRDLGFSDIEKSMLPHKIWKDCLDCPMFPDCDEQAVVIDLR